MLLKIAKHIILFICLIFVFSCKFLDSKTFPLTDNCKNYYKVLQDSIQIDGKKIYMYRIDSSDCDLFVRYDQKKTNLEALEQFLFRNNYLQQDSASQDSVLPDTVISNVEVVEEAEETKADVSSIASEPVKKTEIDSSKKSNVYKDSLSTDSSQQDSSGKKKKKKDGFLGLF